MQEYIGALGTLGKGIDRLEEEHNEVVDTHAQVYENVQELSESMQHDLNRIRSDLSSLRDQIHERIVKAKRATVLLGLIAQSEELRQIQARTDKQPYELYATGEWFESLLKQRLGSRKSDS